jgi:hypothetical protein
MAEALEFIAIVLGIGLVAFFVGAVYAACIVSEGHSERERQEEDRRIRRQCREYRR